MAEGPRTLGATGIEHPAAWGAFPPEVKDCGETRARSCSRTERRTGTVLGVPSFCYWVAGPPACSRGLALGGRLEMKQRGSVVTRLPRRRSHSTQTKLAKPDYPQSGLTWAR